MHYECNFQTSWPKITLDVLTVILKINQTYLLTYNMNCNFEMGILEKIV